MPLRISCLVSGSVLIFKVGSSRTSLPSASASLVSSVVLSGMIAWLMARLGWRRVAPWLALVTAATLGLGYAAERPLYFAHEEASHTHAFDDWTSPFGSGQGGWEEARGKLLAKVEELTLHMIEQEKENRELRDQMNQQTKEIQELRERLGSPEKAAADDLKPAAAK